MSTLRYTEEHEWIRLDDDVGTVGISDFAQEQLGDVVYVELPEVGKTVAQFAEVAVVESVKAASEVRAPVSGEVIEVNEALGNNPELANSSPIGDGWFFKLRISDLAELDNLMDEAAYKTYVEGLG
ncbi:MAG: glycine cleavage system protein GcvH [Alphaproteobacteria bacterium]